MNVFASRDNLEHKGKTTARRLREPKLPLSDNCGSPLLLSLATAMDERWMSRGPLALLLRATSEGDASIREARWPQ